VKVYFVLPKGAMSSHPIFSEKGYFDAVHYNSLDVFLTISMQVTVNAVGGYS